jgi:hypothetical protein
VTRRVRILRYGISIGLALIGVICGATLPGTLGGTLATGLIGIGLVGVLSLIFYEVGLSEDRDRAARRTSRLPPYPSGDGDVRGHGDMHLPASGDPAGRIPPASDSHEHPAHDRQWAGGDRSGTPRRLSRRRGERRRLR